MSEQRKWTAGLRVEPIMPEMDYRAPCEGDYALVTDTLLTTAIVFGGLVVSARNAKLYSAAPEMYEILSAIIGHGIDYPDLEQIARAALKKADCGK